MNITTDTSQWTVGSSSLCHEQDEDEDEEEGEGEGEGKEKVVHNKAET